jgi:cytochrome c oxidase subunit 2
MSLQATMSERFALFPDSASAVANSVDHLYLYLVLVAVFFVTLICALIVFFAVRYRRGGRRMSKYHPGEAINLPLEIAWAAVPLILVLISFAWGADLYVTNAAPREGGADVFVVGRQWMWKLQHPEGRTEINQLHVPVGRVTSLTMTSEDVIHSFFLPAFRIKQDVVPGRYSRLWFEPDRPGRYDLFCAEYCGTEHSRMVGTVVVLEPAQYQEWLSGGSANESMAVQGERLFVKLGCNNCHVKEAGEKGPDLAGRFGTTEELNTGVIIEITEGYVRESILDPTARIVKGFDPIMPPFRGQVTEEDMMKLIAYLKSLAARQDGSEKK